MISRNSKSETETGSMFAIIVLRPFDRLRTSLRFFAKVAKPAVEGRSAQDLDVCLGTISTKSTFRFGIADKKRNLWPGRV
jgi:hypothetical protein